MVFENGVKNIQAAAYNGARTVYKGWDQTSYLWCKCVIIIYASFDDNTQINCFGILKSNFMICLAGA